MCARAQGECMRVLACVSARVGVDALARACACVYVYLLTQHVAHAPYCHLRPLWLHRIFRHYLINGTIFGKKLLNIKCVF